MGRNNKDFASGKLAKELAEGNMPMFMTPKEIVDHFQLSDSPLVLADMRSTGPKSTEQKEADEETLAYKLKDSKHPQSYNGKTSLYDSVANKGVQKPLSVGTSPWVARNVLTDGHHRLAAARNANPNQFLSLEWH